MLYLSSNSLIRTAAIFAFAFCLGLSTVYGQEITRVLFVFDASNSMNAKWESGTKLDVARLLLNRSMDELKGKPNVELGLRVYGHQTAISQGYQDCDDTRLEVNLRPNNNELIKSTLKRVSAKGTTPIARSLELSAEDFPPCDNCRNVIILITDGIEACDGDPCAVSRALQKRGVILKPFVIGIGLDDSFAKSFSCVGNYFDASREEMFDQVLNIVISQALNNTTAQVNLLTTALKPLESDVPVSFFNESTGTEDYYFVHTLNHKGNPDTLSINPAFSYEVVAHTIPPVSRKAVTLTAGMHNIIALEAGTGYLNLKTTGGSSGKVQAIVRKAGNLNTVHVQKINSVERYLNGAYDLELLTLPRTLIKNVQIDQSHTTTVEIPEAGAVSIQLPSAGYGALFLLGNERRQFVANLDENQTNQQFELQPGEYEVVYRSRNSKETLYTQQRTFTITSGTGIAVKF